MGSSKAQLMHRISWEVTEHLTQSWKHGYVEERCGGQQQVKDPGMGDGTAFTVKLHPTLYLDIQSFSLCAQEQPAALTTPCRCSIHMGTCRQLVAPEFGEGSPQTPGAQENVVEQNGSPLA